MPTLPKLTYSSATSQLSLGLPRRGTEEIRLGGDNYSAEAISQQINSVTGGAFAYIHGSNSSSLQTFAAEGSEWRGFLLPASVLKEKEITCLSGEHLDPKFAGQYDEGERSSVFAYKYIKEACVISDVAPFANINLSENSRFPVIYVINESCNFTEYDNGECTSQKDTGVPPCDILGILVPNSHVGSVKDMVNKAFPIQVMPFSSEPPETP